MKEKSSKKEKEKRKKIGKEKDRDQLECAVNGVPSQIHTLKFLTHPAPQVPPLGHELSNRMKILSNMFSIFYFKERTQSLE